MNQRMQLKPDNTELEGPLSAPLATLDAAAAAAARMPAVPASPSTIERVEEMLDATELAIGLIEQDELLARETLDRAEAERGEAATGVLLTVAIPVYNERETIREIVRRVQAVPLEKEIVIVDDCSTDGTRDVLRELATEPGIRVFYHEFNHGKGAALRTAFLHAQGELVLVQDADLEYDPSDYPKLLEPILDGRSDVVYGSRFLGSEVRDPSFIHRLGNRLLTGASNLFTGQRLTDMETCYKVMRRDVLQSIEIEQDRFGFEPEITAKLSRRRQRIVEVPIAYHGRGYEEGKKIGLRDAFNALYCIVRYSLRD
jgi:glycosyltransferase involved in cell wall biosynthesis